MERNKKNKSSADAFDNDRSANGYYIRWEEGQAFEGGFKEATDGLERGYTMVSGDQNTRKTRVKGLNKMVLNQENGTGPATTSLDLTKKLPHN